MRGRAVALVGACVLGVAFLVAGCGIIGGGLGLGTRSFSQGVAAASLYDESFPSAAIRVGWIPPEQPPPNPTARGGYVVGYEVHRSTVPDFPLTAATMQAFVQGGSTNRFVDSEGAQPAVTVTVSTQSTGLVTVDVQDAGATPTPALTRSDSSNTYTIVPTPLVSGTAYYYAICVVSKWLIPVPFDVDGGASLDGTLRVSQPVYVGPITAVRRPVLVDPPDLGEPGSQEVDLRTVVFQWEMVGGGNRYVIEVSTDPSFGADNVVRSSEYVVPAPQDGAVLARQFTGADLSRIFRNVQGPIYWRVGARHEGDPTPVDINGQPVGYVYSAPRAFQVQTPPPPPPS